MAQLKQFINEQAGTAQLRRNVQRNIQNEVQLTLELVVLGLAGHFSHVPEMGVRRGLAEAARARSAECGGPAFVLLVVGQGLGPLRGQGLFVHGRMLAAGPGVSRGGLRRAGIPAGRAVFFSLKLCRPLRGQGFLIVLRHDAPR